MMWLNDLIKDLDSPSFSLHNSQHVIFVFRLAALSLQNSCPSSRLHIPYRTVNIAGREKKERKKKVTVSPFKEEDLSLKLPQLPSMPHHAQPSCIIGRGEYGMP